MGERAVLPVRRDGQGRVSAGGALGRQGAAAGARIRRSRWAATTRSIRTASFAIPAIYLNDWPDRYIHTNFDTAANIDPTKLKRVAFIGAASAYYLANDNRLGSGAVGAPAALPSEAKAEGNGKLVFHRLEKPRGPMAVFGYDYFAEHAKVAGLATPKLLDYEGLRGEGTDYAYEALNFADGTRNAQQICDALSAEYGPVPVELVVEYLRALEKIGVIRQSP